VLRKANVLVEKKIAAKSQNYDVKKVKILV